MRPKANFIVPWVVQDFWVFVFCGASSNRLHILMLAAALLEHGQSPAVACKAKRLLNEKKTLCFVDMDLITYVVNFRW